MNRSSLEFKVLLLCTILLTATYMILPPVYVYNRDGHYYTSTKSRIVEVNNKGRLILQGIMDIDGGSLTGSYDLYIFIRRPLIYVYYLFLAASISYISMKIIKHKDPSLSHS